ncbi:hypothetical protein E2C00_15165 [Streptomyces sp. WAC05374]|nr:hypothetical protein EF905_31420 [Streptomyces sp. WAC05374]TDF48408.1 hypothetical protein E2B92_05890 [Streptomyces sp. WAC05374]TDF55036.1 hypothetical protein E2C02_16495 [Streptomyces sp. WAC05374]TDF55342.1 hypothetical protein E2C00_15165 [Streptomyces sp. WAC05374]
MASGSYSWIIPPAVVGCARLLRKRQPRPLWPWQTLNVPGMRRSAPGVRLRALTVSGRPRMLKVALRACAPQTEQVALASVVCPLGSRGASPGGVGRFLGCPASSAAIRALGVAVPTTSCPYRSPFPHDEQHRDHRHHPAGCGQRHR